MLNLPEMKTKTVYRVGENEMELPADFNLQCEGDKEIIHAFLAGHRVMAMNGGVEQQYIPKKGDPAAALYHRLPCFTGNGEEEVLERGDRIARKEDILTILENDSDLFVVVIDPTSPEMVAAKKTLESLGYTWEGGEVWKPPLGKAPEYITGKQSDRNYSDADKQADCISILKRDYASLLNRLDECPLDILAKEVKLVENGLHWVTADVTFDWGWFRYSARLKLSHPYYEEITSPESGPHEVRITEDCDIRMVGPV